MKYVVISGYGWREERFEFTTGSVALTIAEQLAEHHVADKDEDDYNVRVLVVPEEPTANLTEVVDATIDENSKKDEEI